MYREKRGQGFLTPQMVDKALNHGGFVKVKKRY